jgi:hypothetical protein
MSNLKFDEDFSDINSNSSRSSSGGMTGWLMKKGVTKNKNTANIILFVFAVVVFVISLIIFNS